MTCPRNPSEIARLEDEAEYYRDLVKQNRSVASKYAAEKKLKEIERLLNS